MHLAIVVGNPRRASRTLRMTQVVADRVRTGLNVERTLTVDPVRRRYLPAGPVAREPDQGTLLRYCRGLDRENFDLRKCAQNAAGRGDGALAGVLAFDFPDGFTKALGVATAFEPTS
jgi:hypothetical protein